MFQISVYFLIFLMVNYDIIIEIIEFHTFKISGNLLTNIYIKSWWYQQIFWFKSQLYRPIAPMKPTMTTIITSSSLLSLSSHFVGWINHTILCIGIYGRILFHIREINPGKLVTSPMYNVYVLRYIRKYQNDQRMIEI